MFDPGLQPERTALAWRRTTISLVLGALVSLRILPPVLGHWSLSIGFGGLVLAGLLWRQANVRSAIAQRNLRSGEPLPGGSLPLAIGLAVSGAGMLALTFVLYST